ncbi:MAG: YchJ family protein [Pseudomonadales bacterium]
MRDSAPCACGSGRVYARCCARWHRGEAAPTAEALMRSRYTAFVLLDTDYLRNTWHPRTRPPRLELDPRQRWLGLTIRRTEGGDADALWGEVEFVARFKRDGRGYRLHETSRFERIDGRWLYVDGEVSTGA